MCLALPMRILSVDGDLAMIAAEGLEQRASVVLVPHAGVGDWVLVHAGYALNVLAEDEALERIDLITQLRELDPPEGAEEDEG
jgi:hydrogenase expression/formation protein HypC